MISSKKGSQNGPPEGTSPLRRYFPVFDQKVVQKWLTFWKKRKSLLERERHFFSSQKRKCDNKRIYQQNALRSPRARGNVFWPLFDQNRWFWTTFFTKNHCKCRGFCSRTGPQKPLKYAIFRPLKTQKHRSRPHLTVPERCLKPLKLALFGPLFGPLFDPKSLQMPWFLFRGRLKKGDIYTPQPPKFGYFGVPALQNRVKKQHFFATFKTGFDRDDQNRLKVTHM